MDRCSRLPIQPPGNGIVSIFNSKHSWRCLYNWWRSSMEPNHQRIQIRSMAKGRRIISRTNEPRINHHWISDSYHWWCCTIWSRKSSVSLKIKIIDLRFHYLLVLRPVETEVWRFADGENDIISPKLTGFSNGIGLYIVDFDFCRDNRWNVPSILSSGSTEKSEH